MARSVINDRDDREMIVEEMLAVESAYGRPYQWLGFDPSASGNFVNTSTASSRFVVGGYYRHHKKIFMYTQFKDAVAYAVGDICFHDASLGGIVTNDVSEAASASKPQVMGVCLGVQTADYYGFVQTHGRGTVLHNNDDDAAIGDPIIATVADHGLCNVGTWSYTLGVGIGEVAVVAGTDLQQVFIVVGNDPWM
jgi:hypothetical protein